MRFPTRSFLLLALPTLAGCASLRGLRGGSDTDLLVYFGTNTGTDAQSNSIYLYRLSTKTGALIPLSTQTGGAQPSYLTVDAAHRYLYAVSETSTFRGQPNTGGVSSFSISQQTGALTLLDQQPSLGASPCYVSLDKTGHYALVANYAGGTVAALPVQGGGQLGEASASRVHQPPTGPHPNQDHPHAHCILTSPDNQYAFAVDLGIDKVLSYEFDAASGHLTPRPTPAFTAKPGAGPRHLVFHPGGKFAYLENELNSTVTALTYDAAEGTFREVQTLTTLPSGFVGENSGADVHVSPDGHFLYTSNRGDNSLAVFSINPGTGRLTLVEHVSTQGRTPRNFALTPDGGLLLVANQNSGNVVSYFVDKASGKLRPTGQSAQVPTPMFVQFVPDFLGGRK